ncbi:MAG: DUF3750 domain-containing protein [Planctomycetota bacterium]
MKALAVCAVLVLAGCAPTSRAYFEEHAQDKDYAVRIWQARLPSPLWWAAVHCIVEVRTPEMPPGPGETWEVWQHAHRDEERGESTHVMKSLGTFRGGVGGGEPTLVSEWHGEPAKRAIEWMRRHAPTYQARERYLAWPGPNSNTFVADLLRDCPDVSVDLPPTAIGKDHVGLLRAQRTTTGLGVQLDLLSFVGFQVGLTDGVEVHLLGTALGVAFWPPAFKLPGVGRVGFQQ